jgi:hypothetical protein
VDVDQPEDAPLVREAWCLNSLRHFVPGTLGAQLQEIGIKSSKVVGPLIAYDEGWLIERVPFPSARGFNIKQIRPSVLIDKGELQTINLTLIFLYDRMIRALTSAREPGAEAVGLILARQLAQIPKSVQDQILEVTARHEALHFIEGILRYTPQQFRDLEESQLSQWTAAIGQSHAALTDYLADPEQWRVVEGRALSWLPITLFPVEGGQFRLTRSEVEQLRDHVLLPLKRAMHTARATGGDEPPGRRLARWRGESAEGKAMTALLDGPAFIAAKIGILAMTPEQLSTLRDQDFLMWHQAVYAAIRACDVMLNDPQVWITEKTALVTWYSANRLPHPDNILTPDVRGLQKEFEEFVRVHGPGAR